MKKTRVVCIRVDSDFYELLEKAASIREWSVSHLVRFLLCTKVNERLLSLDLKEV